MNRELKTSSSRKEAKLLQTTYYIGKPCKNCSETKRYTSNTRCVDCFNKERAEIRSLNIEKSRKRERESYYKHKSNKQEYSKRPDIRARKTFQKRTRDAIKLRATPKWSNLEEIAEIYRDCPKGYHVDHIIPLKSKLVCGLHVPENLRAIPKFDNLSKGNKFQPLFITNRQ